MGFIIKNKAYIIAGVILIAVIALVLAVVFCGGGETELPRTAITTTEEIDFDNGTAHTADAGIAVIGQRDAAPNPLHDYSAEDNIIRISTHVQGTTENPDTIWQEDESLTHGGFTIAVPEMDGESVGILTIPDIGVSAPVYEGEDDMSAMEKGVARFRHTSAWEGHIGLSAHNINLNGTPGHFLNIHTLKNGAIIRYETALGVREYAVESVFEVEENDWSALSRTRENRISLVTCITGKPALRLVVTAVEIA